MWELSDALEKITKGNLYQDKIYKNLYRFYTVSTGKKISMYVCLKHGSGAKKNVYIRKRTPAVSWKKYSQCGRKKEK